MCRFCLGETACENVRGAEARLSPLGHAHLNCLGRYTFTTSAPAAGLRPLRDPDSAGDTGET